jgi:hypothetical protein
MLGPEGKADRKAATDPNRPLRSGRKEFKGTLHKSRNDPL